MNIINTMTFLTISFRIPIEHPQHFLFALNMFNLKITSYRLIFLGNKQNKVFMAL